MDVTYTDKARQWGEGFSLLQQATTRLQEILGPSAGLVKAEWDRTEDDQHRVLYTLRISDGTEEATTVFSPDELRSGFNVSYRLNRLWGHILQDRSHKLLEKIQANGGSEN